MTSLVAFESRKFEAPTVSYRKLSYLGEEKMAGCKLLPCGI
jgi:hypothetical protein